MRGAKAVSSPAAITHEVNNVNAVFVTDKHLYKDMRGANVCGEAARDGLYHFGQHLIN